MGYSLSNSLVMLAKYPHVQEKLRQATKDVEKPHLTPYFKCVLKEVMRMIPVAALGSVRVVGREFTSGDYIIPKEPYVSLASTMLDATRRSMTNPMSSDPNAGRIPPRGCLPSMPHFLLGLATVLVKGWPWRKSIRHCPVFFRITNLSWKMKGSWIFS